MPLQRPLNKVKDLKFDLDNIVLENSRAEWLTHLEADSFVNVIYFSSVMSPTMGNF